MDYRAKTPLRLAAATYGSRILISSARALVRYAPEGLSLPVRSLAGGESSTQGHHFREGSPRETDRPPSSGNAEAA